MIYFLIMMSVFVLMIKPFIIVFMIVLMRQFVKLVASKKVDILLFNDKHEN